MDEVLPRNTKSTCGTKTQKNLADINTCDSIRLIQACIYHEYYKTFSKGPKKEGHSSPAIVGFGFAVT